MLLSVESELRFAMPSITKSEKVLNVLRQVARLLQSELELSRPTPIRAQLVSTLFGRASNVLMVALAALICGLTAYYRKGDRSSLFIMSIDVLLILSRCATILAFKKSEFARWHPDQWLGGFGLAAIGSSLCWGLFCFTCLAYSHDPVLYVLPILSTVGTAGAVAARNSGVPRLAKTQLCASLLPIMAGCILTDDNGYALLLLLVPAMAAGLLILIAERNGQLVDLITSQRELARLSATDALTGLANRRQFFAILENEFEKARSLDCPLSVLMIDVDHFKRFNDRHGHAAGDERLKQIALVLHRKTRANDCLVARLGGEEFAIILPNTDTLDAEVRALQLLESVRCDQRLSGHAELSHTTISIGLSTLDDISQDPAQLLYFADRALYEAKRSGRNRLVVHGVSLFREDVTAA